MIKSILSPNHQIEVDFFLTSKGKPAYRVLFKDRAVIDTSTFGFDFRDADPMGEDFSIVETKTGSFNETWEMVWGEQREVVNHYRRVLQKAAEYEIMLDVHEPIKATGIRRAYPNMMTREGLRGQEFNAWSVDMNPPEHLTIIPFTRMLAGPIDFTPGIFDLKFDEYKEKNQVNTTLAKQLATTIVVYSPFQMAADLPENYDGHPAFQFIREVGVDWEES